MATGRVRVIRVVLSKANCVAIRMHAYEPTISKAWSCLTRLHGSNGEGRGGKQIGR